MHEKPDPTGQMFGYLKCLGRGDRIHKASGVRRTKGAQLWRMQCICGKVVQLKRGCFDSGKQISCGCIRGTPLMKKTKNPLNIVGQRFGELTAIELTGNKVNGKPTWYLQCDCGLYSEASLTALRYKQRNGYRLNCGTHDWGLWYPPMPIPMPLAVGELINEYLHLCETNKYARIKQHVQDEKKDRLIRACWILTYKRQSGVSITKEYEQNYVRKYLRFAPISAHNKESGKIKPKNRKGIVMTKKQLPTYPPIKKTTGIKTLPKIKFIRR